MRIVERVRHTSVWPHPGAARLLAGLLLQTFDRWRGGFFGLSRLEDTEFLAMPRTTMQHAGKFARMRRIVLGWYCLYKNRNPLAKLVVLHMRAKPYITSRALRRWYGLPLAKDCYLLPVNGSTYSLSVIGSAIGSSLSWF